MPPPSRLPQPKGDEICLMGTLCAKFDELFSFQKFAFDRTGLGYDFSSSNIASSSTTVFISLANNVDFENNDVKTILASKNIDKGKSILGAPLKLDKKETKNPRAKKQHLCQYCGAARHTRPNCYNWLAT